MPNQRSTPLAVCEQCGTEFRPHHFSHGRYCSHTCYGVSRRRPLAERFWEKVRKTDTCWLWIGSRQSQGYGNINQAGKTGENALSHRISWTLHNGPIPDGLDVLHRCDTPACVNPAHLFLGTHQDNMDDMAQKGRARWWGRPQR